MDKCVLRQQVLERLAKDLLQAEQAVRAAHEAATHEENIAENRYDTLELEAAYLATGQARRAEAIRQAMANWRKFRPSPHDASKGIQLGALVCLVDSDDRHQLLFFGPDGGSMKLVSGAQLVQVISSKAPLGRAMLGKCEGDEVSIQKGIAVEAIASPLATPTRWAAMLTTRSFRSVAPRSSMTI
ncbi:MAG: hypothetical protein ABI127_00985 [Dokdonella sp.]